MISARFAIPNTTPPGRSRCAAFTLIELLVVIGVLVIIAGTVLVAYDGAGESAGDDLTRQRMAAVRDGILRFKNDMGYFPGEGPLAPEKLIIASGTYVNGANPLEATSAASIVEGWAAHPMNLWQLFEKPISLSGTNTWSWDPESRRGWKGPYLGGGFQFLLDDAGSGAGFASGARYNRLRSVADAFQRNRENASGSYLRWVLEGDGAPPAKRYIDRFGQPLFLQKTTTAGTRTFTLVSMGPDGEPGTSDDIRLEIGKEQS